MPRTHTDELNARHDWLHASAEIRAGNHNIPLPIQMDEKLIPTPGTPETLSIRFAKAADLPAVLDLYTGHRKAQIDPLGFVKPRKNDDIERIVRNGHAALAIDENNIIRASAIATEHFDVLDGRRNITEIGAVLCDVGGVGLSKIVIDMLALKLEQESVYPARIYAKVAEDNGASNAVFSRSLSWESVSCEAEREELFYMAYREKSGWGNRDRNWYSFNAAASAKAENIINGAVDARALTGRGNVYIPLDIPASDLKHTLDGHYIAKELEYQMI